MGAKYKGRYCGTIGKFGPYSLDPVKVVTVGEGGLIVTDDEELYHKMDYYHDHGHIHDNSLERGAEGKACLGFNFRMSELQGALGLVQLGKLDMAIERMKASKKKILESVGKVDGLSRRNLPDPDGDTATQTVFLLPTAEAARKFQKASKEAGVPCGNLADNTWHYARHWATLREGTAYSRLRCPFDCPYVEEMPSYRPVEWPKTHDILSRTAVYGMDILMDGGRIDKIVKAVQAGVKAAL